MSRESGDHLEAARSGAEQLVQRLTATVQADEVLQAALHDAQQRAGHARQRLDAVESEIRRAAGCWPDRDTPAGQREFARFLAGKTREIRQIVADGIADSRQKADVVRALAEKYPTGTDAPPGSAARS